MNNPYTKADWWKEVDGYLIKTFFPVRTEIVLNQLRNRGLYPQIAAPVFQVNGRYLHGGHLAATDKLAMTGGGTGSQPQNNAAGVPTIWYTLNGSDPRTPGGVSPTAAKYTQPLVLKQSAA